VAHEEMDRAQGEATTVFSRTVIVIVIARHHTVCRGAVVGLDTIVTAAMRDSYTHPCRLEARRAARGSGRM
jgi:hypothetical protein